MGGGARAGSNQVSVVVGSVSFGVVELPKPNVTKEGFVTGLVEVGGRRGPQLQLGLFWNQ